MRRLRLDVLLPVVMAVSVGGMGVACVAVFEEHGGRGDLTVLYDFEGLGCNGAGVASVDFTLEGDEGADASASATCEPGTYTFVDLEADDYLVYLDAYDSGNGLLYTGSFRAAVRSDTGRSVSVSLTPATGQLTLYWTFVGSAACLDVVDVHVELRNPFDEVVDYAYYPCDQAGVTYGDVVSGAWRVWIDGLSAGDAVLYSASNVPFYVDAGEDNAYDIDLTF